MSIETNGVIDLNVHIDRHDECPDATAQSVQPSGLI